MRAPTPIDMGAALQDARDGMAASALSAKHHIGWERARAIIAEGTGRTGSDVDPEPEDIQGTEIEESETEDSGEGLVYTVNVEIPVERLDDVILRLSRDDAIDALLSLDDPDKVMCLQNLMQAHADRLLKEPDPTIVASLGERILALGGPAGAHSQPSTCFERETPTDAQA